MRKIALVGCILAFAVGVASCWPYVASYKHLNFDAADGLEVLEKSATSPDTQGAELHSPKAGMALKLRLSRPTYTVLFDTPLNAIPVVFLSGRDGRGIPLQITGTHVRRVAPGSAAELDGFQASFYVQEAAGQPLSITIADSSGKVLGRETLPYKIVSRGYAYGIEGV